MSKVSKESRICKFCGKEFIPNSNNQWYCKRPHYRTCPVCGKQYLEDNVENLKRPPVACSYECRKEKRKQSSLKRYGITTPGNNLEARAKAKETMRKKYGVDYAQQSSSIRDKTKQTWIDKFSVDNPMKNKEIQDKAKSTTLERYGSYPFNSKECYEKQHQTMIERYGVPYYTMTDELKESQGHIISKINKQFGQKLSDAGIQYEFEFCIANRSYDIYIPDQNTLIEIDPSYTHNVVGNHWGTHVDKLYHLHKSELADLNGYNCIHVFDWDDIDKIVYSLSPKIVIDADDCQLWTLTQQATDKFLNQYDFRGTCRNQLLCLGLVNPDGIIQVMTFGKSVWDKDHYITIRRYCTKFGYQVVNGGKKLFDYATQVMELYSINAYCDFSKSNGSEYKELGMNLIRKNPPRLIWSKGLEYMTYFVAFHYASKHVDVSNTDDVFIFMLNDSWLPVYDCGQYIFSTND